MSNLEEELGKGLAEIIPEVYRDLAKPSVIKLGTAVGSILGVVLGPAGRLGEIGETNLIKLVNRLDAVSDIQEVQPELAGPILERLRYTRSEELSSLYIELFTKAASKAQASSAHPSFFEVITNLSIDEARVLEYAKRNLKEGSLGIPCLQIKATEENGGFDITREYFASLDSVVSFINLRGEEFAFENLIRLGLLKPMGTIRFKENSDYEVLEKSEKILRMKNDIEITGSKFSSERKALAFSEFLKSFVQTCIL